MPLLDGVHCDVDRGPGR